MVSFLTKNCLKTIEISNMICHTPYSYFFLKNPTIHEKEGCSVVVIRQVEDDFLYNRKYYLRNYNFKSSTSCKSMAFSSPDTLYSVTYFDKSFHLFLNCNFQL